MALNIVDFAIDENGELLIGANGDVKTVTSTEQIAQEIMYRLKTSKGDWLLDPTFGANLEDYIGRKNDSETRELIQQAVVDELSRNGLLTLRQVRVLATDVNSVLIVVDFTDLFLNKNQLKASLNLNDGQIFAR